MKTDKYTKIIMTVIAVALVKIAFQDTNLIQQISAHEGNTAVHKIALCNEIGECADIAEDRFKTKYLQIYNWER